MVLKSFIDSMPNLKYVIIELEYHSLGYNISKFNQDWKDRQYFPYTKELYNKSFANILMAKSNFLGLIETYHIYTIKSLVLSSLN